MQHIEFSEMTNRLRRNLMAIAVLIVCISGFDISIGKASAAGVELENLTTEVVLLILVCLLAYHGLAFSIRAFEEYRLWEFKLANKEATSWGGGTSVVELAGKMATAGKVCEKITSNSGAIAHGGQEIFTNSDATALKEASRAAEIYGKRFDNFPTITRLRFWVWDIGIAIVVAVLAVLSILNSPTETFSWMTLQISS